MLLSLATSTLLLPLASALAPTPLFERGHSSNRHHKRQGLSLLSSGVVPAADVSTMMASMLASQSATAAEAGATAEVSSGDEATTGGESSAEGDVSGSAVSSESVLVTASGEGEASLTSDVSSAEPTATEDASGGDASSSAEGTATGSAVEASATTEAAAPAPPSPAAGSEVNIDATVFNLALTLEKLESSFYKEALKKFDVSAMVQAGLTDIQATIIVEQIQVIAFDESTHVSAITGALKAAGATPFDGCSFDFDSALSDPLTFVSVARTLEAVGVSAYLGAAHLITDPILLTVTASVVTLEARHQTLLNVFNGASAASQPFDIPLAPQQILALAGGFLQGCQASDLGLVSNQPLSITGAHGETSFSIGTKLKFSSTISIDLQAFSCQMILGGAPVAQVYPAHSCYVPEGVDGPVAVYLTNNTTPLQSNIIDQAAGAIQAGPGLIFVDSKTTALGSLFNGKGWGHLSADMGALYASKIKGDEKVIQIVKQRTVTDTKSIIITENDGKTGSQHSPSRMLKVRRGSAGVGGARVLG